MMTEIPRNSAGCFLLWQYLNSLGCSYLLFRSYQLGRKGGALVRVVAELLLSLVLYTVTEYSIDGLISLPVTAVLLYSPILSAAAVYEALLIRKLRLNLLTPMSVKDSFDTLPEGICFYREGGLPKLVNRSMDDICRRITGYALDDAESFWNDLSQGTFPCSVRGGIEPIVCLEDGRAYSFKRYSSQLYGKDLFEINAADITEIYRLNLELEEKGRQAQNINDRLKALNSTLKYVMMDKELLRMKIDIHDSFGQTLLMTRRFLSVPEETDRGELLSLWRRNIGMLRSEGREEWQQPYFINFRYAEQMGVELDIEGELPSEDATAAVADTALTVHITNVVRHAGGRSAKIVCLSDNSGYELHFTNSGSPPTGKIRETGGLANLRREAEGCGGSMEIISSPAFEMILKLPKGEKTYGI